MKAVMPCVPDLVLEWRKRSGADQYDELMLGHVEVDARDRIHRAEALAQFAQRQRRQPPFPPERRTGPESMPGEPGGIKAGMLVRICVGLCRRDPSAPVIAAVSYRDR